MFPPGTLVRLANKEVGIVVRRGHDAAHPQVARVMTAEEYRASVAGARHGDPQFAVLDSVSFDRFSGVLASAASLWK